MPRFVRHSSVPLVVLLAAAAAGVAQPPGPNPLDARRALMRDIGYERLAARLRDRTPNGAGVAIAHVEPNVGGAMKWTYRPDVKGVVGERPGFVLNVPGPDSGEVSGHSSQVATELYGKDSMANGVTRVDLLTPDREFLPQWLGLPRGSVRTDTDLPKVSSHSYVEDRPMAAVVRRLDDLIEKTGHVAVVAVGKNTTGDPVASLFGSSYNAIVVGLSNTRAAYGDVRDGDDAPGRTKPDLVVPVAQTSTATPIVAAAVALLVQAAGGDPVATKPVVLKACLLAGATKTFADAQLDGGWQHQNQSQKPLHPKFGAGQLDVDRAHRALTAGRRTPGPEPEPGRSSPDGWATGTIDSKDQSHTYVFEVPDDTEGIEVSAALTWNRRFAGPDLSPVLANFDLRYGRVDDGGQFDRVLGQSVSAIDNVDLIWHTQVMPPGRYGFRVTSTGDEPSEYALSWVVTTRPAPGKKRDPKLGKTIVKRAVPSYVYYAIAVGSIVLIVMLWQLRPMFRSMRPEKKPARRRKPDGGSGRS
jgi:hypothetical protein